MGGLWYLCDTYAPTASSLLEEVRTAALREREHGWARYHTLGGRVCRDLHRPQFAYGDYAHARAAFLSQIS